MTDEMNEEVVRHALNSIIDPCSYRSGVPAGLDDMGLVRDITVTQTEAGAVICVAIGVTEPACLMALPFCSAATQCLRALPGVQSVQVTLATDFDWTPDLMKPEYRARLEEQRARRRAEQRSRALPLFQQQGTTTSIPHSC